MDLIQDTVVESNPVHL